MAFAKLLLFVLHGMLLLHLTGACNVLGDKVFEDINTYRQSLKLPNLTANSNAACLADQMVSTLDGKPCESARNYSSSPGTKSQLPNLTEHLDKCDISPATAVDGVILPSCVPRLVPIAPSNYPGSEFAKYLNDSSYTGAGVGAHNYWVVVVLSTNTSTGSFPGAVSWVANISVAKYMATLSLGLLVFSAS